MKTLLIALSVIFSVTSFAQSKATIKLFEAIDEGKIKSARKAIDDGADINGVNNVNAPTTTVFIRAVKLNRIDIVKLLLDEAAKAGDKNYINQTRNLDLFSGLMIAAQRNLVDMADLLIQRGADVNKTSPLGRNALNISALNNSVGVAKLLVQTSINVNNRAYLCALAVAARQDHREIVELLMSQAGEKAPSPQCFQRALDMADFNENNEVLKILKGN